MEPYARSDIYYKRVSPKDRPLAWLHGAVRTLSFSRAARLEAGFLLRRLQRGELLSMPNLARHRALAQDAMSYESTPKAVIATCRARLKEYENAGK